MKRISHWIDGRTVEGTSGRSGIVFDPATGEQQASVDLASSAEVSAAVDVARRAAVGWRATGLSRRAEVMFRLRELIDANRKELAALHAKKAAPQLNVTIACKGLLGKSGCTRMVQGGYNVALVPGDSVERHFMDTIEGGKWLPHQELAWTLVSVAIERVP